jgi:hypothetical protein
LLTPEQILELNGLDFDWTIQDMISELRNYKEEFGHCDVPLDYEGNPSLGVWVETQRRVSMWFAVLTSDTMSYVLTPVTILLFMERSIRL